MKESDDLALDVFIWDELVAGQSIHTSLYTLQLLPLPLMFRSFVVDRSTT